jgi:phage gpG-like protein
MDASLQKLLKQAEKKSVNLQPLLTKFYGEIKFEVVRNFRMQGSYGDVLSGTPSNQFTKWKELGALQTKNRLVRGSGGAILQDSNRLRMSIGTVRKITHRELEYGTDLEYAAIHHFGGVIVPKRAKMLTLPFPGVDGRARDYENTFIAKNIIFQKLDGGGFRPLFSLRMEVRMPDRPFMTVGNKRLKKFQEMTADFLVGK